MQKTVGQFFIAVLFLRLLLQQVAYFGEKFLLLRRLCRFSLFGVFLSVLVLLVSLFIALSIMNTQMAIIMKSNNVWMKLP